MKLPRDLQPHFPHASLIIASDSVIAKFFLAGGDELEELDGVAEPREPRQDAEGSFASYDGSRIAGPDSDIDDAPRLKTFVKKIAARAAELVRSHAVAHVHLVMPAEVEHALKKEFAPDVAATVMHVRHLDLMKEDSLTIARRVFAG